MCKRLLRLGQALFYWGAEGAFFFHTKKNNKKREREPSVEAVIDLCQNRFGKPYSAFLCLCSGEHQMFLFKACFCSDVQCSNCFSLCSQVLVNQRNTNSYVCENCCSVPRKWVGYTTEFSHMLFPIHLCQTRQTNYTGIDRLTVSTI